MSVLSHRCDGSCMGATLDPQFNQHRHPLFVEIGDPFHALRIPRRRGRERCFGHCSLFLSAAIRVQNDEWCLQRRCMQLEAFEVVSAYPQTKLPAVLNQTTNSVASATMSYTT